MTNIGTSTIRLTEDVVMMIEISEHGMGIRIGRSYVQPMCPADAFDLPLDDFVKRYLEPAAAACISRHKQIMSCEKAETERQAALQPQEPTE